VKSGRGKKNVGSRVEQMEGKCGDWVMVRKGNGENVENVDVFVSKVTERKIVAVRRLEIVTS
jgi:hypothetical protein